jgi:hypothetical protein
VPAVSRARQRQAGESSLDRFMRLEGGMEDRSGFEPMKQYRCKDPDCRKVSLGRDLLPVQRRRLVDDPSHPYGVRETGPVYVGNRVCPFDRGLMESIDLLA